MNKMERWRDVLGFEGLYEVSDHGRVRSRSRAVFTRTGMRRYSPKYLKPNKSNQGFSSKLFYVLLFEMGKPTMKYVGNLVLEAFVRPGRQGESVVFADGDAGNLSLDNLNWGGGRRLTPTSRWHLRKGEHLDAEGRVVLVDGRLMLANGDVVDAPAEDPDDTPEGNDD
jgi:hypothetical protein